jgi:hypothetical protein
MRARHRGIERGERRGQRYPLSGADAAGAGASHGARGVDHRLGQGGETG